MPEIQYDVLKAAILFYSHSPDGQYDEIALQALLEYLEKHYGTTTE